MAGSKTLHGLEETVTSVPGTIPQRRKAR